MRGFIAGAATIGPGEGERRRGEDVGGLAVGDPRHRRGRERRDAEELGDLRTRRDAGTLVAAVDQHRPPRERGERRRADEPARVGGLHDLHVVAVLDEQPNELAGLVRRDAAAHPHQDHGRSVADPRGNPGFPRAREVDLDGVGHRLVSDRLVDRVRRWVREVGEEHAAADAAVEELVVQAATSDVAYPWRRCSGGV